MDFRDRHIVVTGGAGALGTAAAVVLVIPKAARLFAARPHTDADH